MTKFLKLIIPIYNSEKFLSKLFDSIFLQDFDDYVVIAINDQSTDNSEKIIDEYCDKYPTKLIKISCSSKKFQGGCRNIGLKYPIDSKYVWFIDSDDYISENSLSIIFNALKNNFVDMLLFDSNMIYTNNKCISYFNQQKFKIEDENILTKSPFRVPWCKVIKSECVSEFLEDSLFGEDAIQFLTQVQNIKTFMQIDSKLYNYVIHNTSLTHSTSGLKAREKYKSIFIKKLFEILNITDQKWIKQAILNRLTFEGIKYDKSN